MLVRQSLHYLLLIHVILILVTRQFLSMVLTVHPDGTVFRVRMESPVSMVCPVLTAVTAETVLAVLCTLPIP